MENQENVQREHKNSKQNTITMSKHITVIRVFSNCQKNNKKPIQ